MKNILLLTFAFCVVLAACNKKATGTISSTDAADEKAVPIEKSIGAFPEKLNGTVWYVKQFPYEKNANFQPQNRYRISFDKKEYGLQLDKNNCGGSYSVTKNQIDFGAGFCTEMCCDKKEGLALAHLLNGKFAYELNAKTQELIINTKQGSIIWSPARGPAKLEIMSNKWKAISWAGIKEGIHTKFEKKYFLNFEAKRIVVKLDVNTCNTSCKYIGTDMIELPTIGMGCSRACCDSDSGKKLAENLQGKVKYRFEDGSLYLKTFNKEIILHPVVKSEE